MIKRYFLGGLLILALVAEAAAQSRLNEPDVVEIGRVIYQEGRLADGKPLLGQRMGDVTVSGSQAACVNCHRPSGLGGVEGEEIVPPITGKALFGDEPVLVEIDQRSRRALSNPSPKHDDRAFADAVRSGKHVSGRQLRPLMPRYRLTDQELKALAAYLRTLSAEWSPGASQSELHLATVITPEVGAERRKAFVDTLKAMLNQHNVNLHAAGHHKVSPIERKLNSQRTWSLAVWELAGPSSDWQRQLEEKQRQNPAFAILSGLSDSEWQPVQDFCESQRVACWFPSIDAVPAGAAQSRYSVYFSPGVVVEADAVAKRLQASAKKPGTILQIVGPGFVERQLAEASRSALARQQNLRELAWSEADLPKLQTELAGLSENDVVLLWMRGAQLQQLQASLKAPAGKLFLSGTLIGDDWPDAGADWRKNAQLATRYEWPRMRSANLSRFNDWLKYRKLPLVDEKMQSEAFFAANAFGWMTASMLNNLYGNYLIERAEATLAMRDTMQVQEEVQSMMMGGGGRRPSSKLAAGVPSVGDESRRTVDIGFLMKRGSTTIYPRLSLGFGQRFASKGAYLRILAGGEEVGEWLVP